jgi:hypothetical protein
VLGEGTSGSSGASGSPSPTATITFPSPGNETPPPPTAGPTPSKPPPDGGVYTAQAWPGGLDHIDVFKADLATDTCVHIHLVTPAGPAGPLANISTPSGWAVTIADRSAGASSCSRDKRSNVVVQATGAKGFVSWPPTGGKVFPCWLDLNIGLAFPDGTSETMTRSAVDVIGGC